MQVHEIGASAFEKYAFDLLTVYKFGCATFGDTRLPVWVPRAHPDPLLARAQAQEGLALRLADDVTFTGQAAWVVGQLVAIQYAADVEL